MQWKTIKIALAVVGLVSLSGGLVYAYFISNTISIQGNQVSSGEAAVKLCDSAVAGWTTSVTKNFDLGRLLPGQERNLMADNTTLLIGNDNGSLSDAAAPCNAYIDRSVASNTPLRFVPRVAYNAEVCSESAINDFKLRFEVDGIDTGYRSLAEWQTNDAVVEPIFQPGQFGNLKTFVQLNPESTQHNASCPFDLNLVARQAV